MPLLSFSVLKDKLLDESKTQTIRFPRKRPLKVGDKLFIWWKSRTKNREFLGEGKITKIQQKFVGNLTHKDALLDGFSGYGEMIRGLKKLHPNLAVYVKVDVITWEWTQRCFPAKHIGGKQK